jgi:MFS superfamily sulfate permease-like transporter
MLTAIGIIIILKQLPHAFGYDAEAEGQLNFQQSDGNNTFTALLAPLQHIHIGVTLITLISLLIMVLWEKPFMKRFKIIPGALAAVVAAVLLNLIYGAFFPWMTVGKEHLVQVPVATTVNEFFDYLNFLIFQQSGIRM